MTNAPQPKVIRTDADGFSHNEEPAILILEISRKEIESMNFTSSLERLMVMADSRENALCYKESLLLQIRGYDSDRRELCEIPEVRRFFARLVNEWPHWMWFLSREIGMIGLLMSLICEVTVHRSHGQFGIEFTEPFKMYGKLNDLLHRGAPLFMAYDIPMSEAEASAESALLSLDPAK